MSAVQDAKRDARMTSATPTPPSMNHQHQAGVDRSCRVPVLVMFVGAALWLAVGLALNFAAAMKFHKPDFLVSSAWLTYGRIYPAAMAALFYGFALQAGVGTALWMIARLARSQLQGSIAATVAAFFFNAATSLGVVFILAGQGTGHELLDMPAAAAAVLFASFVVLALCALATFQRRQPGDLFVSNWFLLAGLFWFAWVFAVAVLYVGVFPVRGIMQAVVDWWYIGNLQGVVLSLLGLAAVFYFIPKLTGRPLHNQLLAAFAFWTLVAFAPWTGIAPGTPLPAWLPGVSSMFSLLLIISAITVAVIVWRTDARRLGEPDCGVRKYFTVGAYAWVAWVLIGGITADRDISYVVHFTWLVRGLTLLFLYGFLVMVLTGAITVITGSLLGDASMSPALMKATFWLGFLGVVFSVLPLLAGGVMEGLAHANPQTAFTDASAKALMPLRTSTLGDLFMLLAALLFATNVIRAVISAGCANAKPAWRSLSTEVPA